MDINTENIFCNFLPTSIEFDVYSVRNRISISR